MCTVNKSLTSIVALQVELSQILNRVRLGAYRFFDSIIDLVLNLFGPNGEGVHSRHVRSQRMTLRPIVTNIIKKVVTWIDLQVHRMVQQFI